MSASFSAHALGMLDVDCGQCGRVTITSLASAEAASTGRRVFILSDSGLGRGLDFWAPQMSNFKLADIAHCHGMATGRGRNSRFGPRRPPGGSDPTPDDLAATPSRRGPKIWPQWEIGSRQPAIVTRVGPEPAGSLSAAALGPWSLL